MAKLMVNQLPRSCNDCPLQICFVQYEIPKHLKHKDCPVNDDFPKCLKRFSEYDSHKKEEINVE